jgi:predicted protein tyrosine phosphatase
VATISPFKTSVCCIEELAGHCNSCVSHVLSILDPDWPVPDAFGAYGDHARLELRFNDVIEESYPDRSAPQQEHVADLLAFGRGLLGVPHDDAHHLLHCHAGISRSTASKALVLAQALPDVRPIASSRRCCASDRRLGQICEFLKSARPCWAGAVSSLRLQPGLTGPSSIGGTI